MTQRHLAWLSANASYSHSSFALASIHAATREGCPEWDWSEVRATLNDSEWGILKRLVKVEPDLVAATVYLFNRDLVLAVLERLKAVRPHTQIILGGPEFLGDNREFLRENPLVDAVVRGEADIAFGKFLQVWNDPSKWERIEGICWLDIRGEYHDKGLALVAEEQLERMRSPLTSRFYDTAKPFVSLETARGCPSQCAFCTSCRLGVPRYLPVYRTAQDLNRLQQAGVREVRILDRTFNLPVQRCLELLALMESYAEADMRFHVELNPAALTDQILEGLKKFPAGKLHIEAGLQTGTGESLAAISRTFDAERTWQGLENLCAIEGLDLHADLIAGLPHVALADIYRDLQRLVKMCPTEIQLELLKLLPGTPLRSNAAEYGLRFSPSPPYEILATPTMSFAELNEARLLSRAIDLFYNDPALQSATRKGILKDSDFLRSSPHLAVDEHEEPVPVSRKRRFQLLHANCEHLPDVREELQYSWMREGMGASHGLVSANLWKTNIPTGAVCIAGDATASARPCRTWYCRIGVADYWFVYTRERQQKRATAVFQSAK